MAQINSTKSSNPNPNWILIYDIKAICQNKTKKVKLRVTRGLLGDTST